MEMRDMESLELGERVARYRHSMGRTAQVIDGRYATCAWIGYGRPEPAWTIANRAREAQGMFPGHRMDGR